MILRETPRICIIVSFFHLSADPEEPDKITMDGVVKLLGDLQLDPGSRTVLLFAWKLQAAAQCEFSKTEFVTGLMTLE